MSIAGLVSVRKAISKINPKQAREMSERPLQIALYSSHPDGYRAMEDFFLGELSPARRRASNATLVRKPVGTEAGGYDLVVHDGTVAAPMHAVLFEAWRPALFIERALDTHPDLGVALAKNFPRFRRPFVDRVIKRTCRENTLFSLATALPDVIPNIFELPWAVAEFASDTAFLTMNQIRMAFLIAAASDRAVGYTEQKSEIATVIGSAFGWRALARQLVGKVPFGGGLLGKAAVAYAGTKVLGLSLERFYRIGYNYSREERDRLYADAFRQGKQVAFKILSRLRPDVAERFATDASRAQTVDVPAQGNRSYGSY
ncbi:MAG: hypothetical protein JOY62_11860 [Acidobacteriaceae bacterium]|nr:hypothetical protein [Acidobacteriaceae bacterium]MBV9780656.1 hypothetical protein [Acidobacteriaceae bacterium]